MRKDVTLKDIAEKVGVSQATVSLVLNNRGKVSARTREKVLHCVKELRYRPNPIARDLVLNKRPARIGLVCPDTENPFFGSLVKHLSNNCSLHGYSLVISISNNDIELESRFLKNYIANSYDGILIIPTNTYVNNNPIYKTLRDSHLPYLFCISYYKGYENRCCMGDYVRGAFELTKYLLDRGHKEIWYMVADDSEAPVTKMRLQGYKNALANYNVQFKEENIIMCPIIDFDAGYENTKELLSSRKKPDAILVINDYMALGVLNAIHELGYKIPSDISVAGYDDVFYSRFGYMPITTVNQRLDLIAKNAVNKLIYLIDNNLEKFKGIPQMVEPELVIRQTTR